MGTRCRSSLDLGGGRRTDFIGQGLLLVEAVPGEGPVGATAL